LALLLIGLNLIFNSAETLRLFARLNQWVSLRRTLRPLEVPRDIGAAVRRWRPWLAAFFIAGGAFALFGLATRFDARAIISAFGLRPAVASWLLDSAWWALVVGNLAGIAVGIMLAFFPDALDVLETRGSRWYSERRHSGAGEAMHITPLEVWVGEFP